MGNIFDSKSMEWLNKATDIYIFGGLKLYQPKKVIFNNPATIVIWNDGTKTISKCSPNDTFDKMKGFLTCYYKKLSNTTNSQFSKLYDRFEKSEVVEF